MMTFEKNSNKTAAARTGSGGVGFCGLLTIVFIVLKLTGVINWSWVWVLAPIWIDLILVVVLLIIVGIFCYLSKKND